jgi:hypothetical protein
MIVSGRRPIPAGYRLRMPASSGAGFENRLTEFSAEQSVTRAASPRPTRVATAAKSRPRVRAAVLTTRVRRGPTSRASKHQKTSVASARKTSRPAKKSKARPGQNLKIRAQSAA